MRYKINLFPPKEESVFDKAIYFSFHYLRYILVITQIIVIGVFFYRFKIDQEIIDLKESLSQKQEIVKISRPLVREIQALERKITEINKISLKQDQFRDNFDYILDVFPEKLRLNKLTINDKGEYELAGFTSDPSVIKTYYNRLKKDKKFTNIELKNLKREVLGFNFTILLTNSPKMSK